MGVATGAGRVKVASASATTRRAFATNGCVPALPVVARQRGAAAVARAAGLARRPGRRAKVSAAATAAHEASPARVARNAGTPALPRRTARRGWPSCTRRPAQCTRFLDSTPGRPPRSRRRRWRTSGRSPCRRPYRSTAGPPRRTRRSCHGRTRLLRPYIPATTPHPWQQGWSAPPTPRSCRFRTWCQARAHRGPVERRFDRPQQPAPHRWPHSKPRPRCRTGRTRRLRRPLPWQTYPVEHERAASQRARPARCAPSRCSGPPAAELPAQQACPGAPQLPPAPLPAVRAAASPRSRRSRPRHKPTATPAIARRGACSPGRPMC